MSSWLFCRKKTKKRAFDQVKCEIEKMRLSRSMRGCLLFVLRC